MKTKQAARIIGSIARTLLAVVFIFSGFVKAVDPLGTTYKIEDYLTAFGSFFTVFIPIAEPIAWLLIAFEFLLGISLLLNIKTQLTSWLALLLLCFMTPLTLYIAIANPVSDCGCFGDALVLSNWATFWKNIVLLLLVVILLVTKKYIPQTFTNHAETYIFIFFLLILIGIMSWSRLRLPLIDFRPYKVGNNLVELMEVPENAEPDIYQITFIYQKDGVEQEFTLNNYPKGDTTWHFVDQKSVLVKKGYEPAIHDFEVVTMDYDDITYDILESDKPVTLVVMYDLDKTNRKQLTKVTKLYNDCLAADNPFYIVTGASTEAIELFCEDISKGEINNTITPFNHPNAVFCMCDGTALKTIVRANPGVIVLQNGTVIEKYNMRNK